VGGIITAISGLIIAFFIDFLFPKYMYELTWQDIALVLNNIYKYGKSPCEMRFYVEHRKITVYRDERDRTPRGGGPIQIQIRMAVCLPIAD
jgi:hypothetical protein